MTASPWWQQTCLQPDAAAEAAALARQAQLTKPRGALGALEALAVRLAALQGREKPAIDKPHLTLFAGDHGVVAEGVESEAQADFFTASACEELQGFLFCRPLPPDDLAGFLAAQARPGPVQATPLPAPPALAATD